jgi:HAD superfamily hydrolase (TIGR01509 family)
MIKLIIFDLDGVLLNSKKLHFETLNEALGPEFSISWEEHLNKFDGLKTNQKLEILTREKKLPLSHHKSIWEKKQSLTAKALSTLGVDNKLINIFQTLSELGYKIAVCSNSIRKTVLTTTSKLGVIEFLDLILSNEDVKNGKPHPEIYWKAISSFGLVPEETLIIEDSPYGLLAASRSNSHILRVSGPEEVTLQNIQNNISKMNLNPNKVHHKWKDEKLNVLIPMAGAGSRFQQAGYTFPKPLIEVQGKPMIQVVVENLNIDAHYIFVVQKSHRKSYNLDSLLRLIAPGCEIVEIDGITEGAACTALLAKEFIDNDQPLFFANSDQFVEWNSIEFMYKMNETQADGGIVTFEATHPKWSFAKLDSSGLVTEVAEKKPISNVATVGFYYWKKGSDFVKYAESMIQQDVRVNGEFYVCPVFNHAISDGKKIRNYQAEKMWGLGTPEDLKFFLENKKS